MPSPENKEKLEDREVVLNLNIPLRLSFDPTKKNNFLHMTFSDTSVKASQDGKTVGEVLGCLGGGVEFRLTGDKRTWYASAKDMMFAFFEALEKDFCKKDGAC